jgi:hypothetical protein
MVNVIKRIIAEQGEAILGDAPRLKGLVADYASRESKVERIAFGYCIEYGAYTELKGAEDRDAIKAAIAQRVNANEGIEIALCNDALDTLEAALFGETKPRKALCLKCGKELEAGWTVCPFCGAGSAAVQPKPAASESPPPVTDIAAAPKAKHTKRNVLIMVAALAVVVRVWGFYTYAGSDVYVAGIVVVDEDVRATYWKKGQPVCLSESGSAAYSIFVASRAVRLGR